MQGKADEAAAASAPQRAPWRLTPRERVIGTNTLRLVLTWPSWVHRRVESIALQDPVTVLRRVSVDFTLLPNLATVIRDGLGEPIYFVPLTFLKKLPLTNFDLQDETGAALPLLTRQRNSILATSMLISMAEVIASDPLKEKHGAAVPDDLARDLWQIATLRRPQAYAVRDGLASRGAGDPSSKAWRTELAQDSRFMAIARTLAANFVVAVPLRGATGTRRIL